MSIRLHPGARRRLGNALNDVLKDAQLVPRGQYPHVTEVVPVSERSVLVVFTVNDKLEQGANAD
jgi:hypothetical protein